MTSLTDTLATALRALLAAHDAPTYGDSLAYADHISDAVEPARAALAEYDARPEPITCGAVQYLRADGTPAHRIDFFRTIERAEEYAARCKQLKTANVRVLAMQATP